MEGLGESFLEFLGQGRRGAEGDGGFAELVIERSNVVATGGRFVGQYNIQSVRGELGDQIIQFPLPADDLSGASQTENGSQDLVGDEFGQRIGHTDVQADRFGGRALLDRVGEFLTEGKDLVGVAQRDLTCVGEHIRSTLAAEEFFAEITFEFGDLSRDGGGAKHSFFPPPGGDCPRGQPPKSSADDEN